MTKFHCLKKSIHDELEVIISGPLDESAAFPDLDLKGYKTVTLNCAKINHINSIGIQKWVKFVQSLEAKFPGILFTFSECTVSLIQQMNTVVNFLPKNSNVESFSVPYFCESCSRSDVTLYRKGKEIRNEAKEIIHPKIQCPQCESEMEPDVLLQSYFNFLKPAA